MNLQRYLPPYMGNADTIVSNHNVFDIVGELTRAQKIFSSDYSAIAKKFWRGDAVETYKHLFDYCRDNFRYNIESENLQTTRSPAAILATAKTVGVDCKHYALWIGGILSELKRQGYDVGEIFFRFVSYDIADKLPGHVFILARYRGKDYYIDPVLSSFNKRFPVFYYKLDKKIDVMPLQRISGIGLTFENFIENSPIVPQPGQPKVTTDLQLSPVTSQSSNSVWLMIGAGALILFFITKNKRRGRKK